MVHHHYMYIGYMTRVTLVRYAIAICILGIFLFAWALKRSLYFSTMSTMNENTSVSSGDIPREIPPVPAPREEQSLPGDDLGVFELPMNQPVHIADFTATLVDNNHKFQDNPYDSYVWVTIKIVFASGETQNIVLNYQTYKGDDGTVKVMNEPTMFGGYAFTPLDIGYDYYVKVRITKQSGV